MTKPRKSAAQLLDDEADVLRQNPRKRFVWPDGALEVIEEANRRRLAGESYVLRRLASLIKREFDMPQGEKNIAEHIVRTVGRTSW